MGDLFCYTCFNENGDLVLYMPKTFMFDSFPEAIEAIKTLELDASKIVGIACLKMKYHTLYEM